MMTQTASTGSGEVGGDVVLKASPDSSRNIFRPYTLLWHRRRARHVAFFLQKLRQRLHFASQTPGCVNICWAHVWLHRGLVKPISLHASFLDSCHWDGMRQGWWAAAFTVIAQSAVCMRDDSYKVWSHENPHWITVQELPISSHRIGQMGRSRCTWAHQKYQHAVQLIFTGFRQDREKWNAKVQRRFLNK